MLHTDESIYFSPHCKILRYIIAIRLKIRTYSKYNIVHKQILKNTLASSLHVAGYGHFVHITGNVLPRKTAREEFSQMTQGEPPPAGLTNTSSSSNLVFPGGLPSRYWPVSTPLSFSGQPVLGCRKTWLLYGWYACCCLEKLVIYTLFDVIFCNNGIVLLLLFVLLLSYKCPPDI